jgi:hypothetical protein
MTNLSRGRRKFPGKVIYTVMKSSTAWLSIPFAPAARQKHSLYLDEARAQPRFIQQKYDQLVHFHLRILHVQPFFPTYAPFG